MTTDATKEVALPPAMALARSIFRAQNDEQSTAKYKDEKEKWVPLARKTLKALENHGYKLTKIEE